MGFSAFCSKVELYTTLNYFSMDSFRDQFFYTYFLIVSGGLAEADFSNLEGITKLFRLATPESAAAGWLHYLAFDFWVGTWIIRHSRRHQISHWVILPALAFTFMLGPIGIMAYSIIYFIKHRLNKAK